MDTDLLAAVFAAVVAAAAAVTVAAVAYRAAMRQVAETVKQTHRAANANTINSYLALRDRFHRNKIRRAIASLVEFRKAYLRGSERPYDAGIAFLYELDGRDDLKAHYKDCIRVVSCFFEDVAFLLIRKLIDKESARLLINVPGLNVYYDICVPILLVQDQDAVTATYAEALQGVLAIHGHGIDGYITDWADFDQARSLQHSERVDRILRNYLEERAALSLS